jgi:prophage regulatory protein
MTDDMPAQYLRLAEVIRLTRLSRSTIYRLQSSGEFPMGRKLSARTTRWLATEVADWVASRPAIKTLPRSPSAEQRTQLDGRFVGNSDKLHAQGRANTGSATWFREHP